MKKFLESFSKRRSLKTKLIIGFSLVILMVILSSVYNYTAFENTNKKVEIALDEHLNLLILCKDLAGNMSERTSLLQGYLLSNNESYRTEFSAGIEETINLENQLLKSTSSDTIKELIDKKIQWGHLTDNIFEEIDNNNREKAIEILVTQVQPLEAELVSGLNKVADEYESEFKKLGSYTINYGKDATFVGVVILLLIILTILLVAAVVTKSTVAPIREIVERLTLISTGDLTNEPFTVDRVDEAGQLASAINKLQEELKIMLTDISRVSETVAGHSEELTQSAIEVSAGSEQISATMQELASSLYN